MRVTILRLLCVALGIAICVIGLAHIVFGAAMIRGAGDAGPSFDSEDRFFGAVFFGYGLGWLLCASNPTRWRLSLYGQTAIFFLGGVGRIVSIVVVGRPHDLYVVLMVIELAAPVALVALLIGLPVEARRRAPALPVPRG